MQNLIARVEKRVPTIWGGDFNTILDTNPDLNSNLDLRNRATHPGPKVTNKLASIRINGLIDAFRAVNGEQESFTFVNNSGGSRLDYCLLSSHFGKLIKSVDHTLLSNLFDHHAVITNLASKKRAIRKCIIDDVIEDRTCIRVIRFANFIQKYDLLRNTIDENLRLDCEKIV